MMWTDLLAALISSVVGFMVDLLATGLLDFISALFGVG
jgi:hypothetical protein